jgi:FeS assembly protein IscX
MPDKLTWKDVDEIGYRLSEAYAETDPLTVRFTQLRDMVVALPGFTDDPAAVSEKALESIQMAWLEYAKDS